MDGPHVVLSLQALDTELDQLRFRRAHLPARAELEAVLVQQRGVEVEGAQASAARDTLAQRQAELEVHLGDTEKRLVDLDRQMRSGAITAARDLQAMVEQVASMKRRQSEIEDAELEVMEELDPAEARVVELQGRWTELEEEAVRLRAALAESEVAVDAELDAVLSVRAELVVSVPEALRERYEKLRARMGGVGAASLVGASCGGCHLTLSASELDRIRRLPPDEVGTCEQCGRLLVR